MPNRNEGMKESCQVVELRPSLQLIVDKGPLSVVEVSLWKLRAEEFSISAD